LKLLYKYVCEDTNFGNLLGNLISIFFCEVHMRTNSQTITISAATTFLAFAMIATPSLAFAASAHFIGTPTIVKNPNASLTATFKAAGLGNVVTNAFLTSSGGTAVLQCVNPGGNNPPPKQVSFGPTQGQTTTIPPSNGQITASASIGPPPLPSASQICPNPNWSVRLISITYDNVVLHLQQNGVDLLTYNFGNVDPEVVTVAAVSRQ
jgi:hypothetical protein